ncbi:GLPGLI family protein [Maribacter sedimenticola]|uniref:GLPGLI family protein n=1 Tax=Maribacter sedimenticola TaxID=228956 RepID=A0ABY1SHQ3_9FLAO|nr:GLPGLI family protein [Maribacter sedimenticola]SNR47072.1 GLPGLI family protein [Maribacter sedimenticola]
MKNILNPLIVNSKILHYFSIKEFIVLLLLVFNFHSSISQELKGKITYQATLSDYNKLEWDNMINSLDSFTGLDKSNPIPINFHLLFDSDKALYQAEYDLETKRKMGFTMNETGLAASHDRKYFTNLQTQEHFYQSFWTKDVLVNLDKVEWNLTNVTKMIGKYMCYKATAIIDSEQIGSLNHISPVVAWYTPEIPLPFGIQSFNGLPGLTMELTMELEKGKVTYIVTNIEISPEEKIILERPNGTKWMSEKEYISHIKKLNANR